MDFCKARRGRALSAEWLARLVPIVPAAFPQQVSDLEPTLQDNPGSRTSGINRAPFLFQKISEPRDTQIW